MPRTSRNSLAYLTIAYKLRKNPNCPSANTVKTYQIPAKQCHQSLLKALLGHYLNCEPDQVHIQFNSNGKPWHPAIYFSISHSRNRTLIALDFNRPLGVDLEAHRPVRNMAQIAKRFGFNDIDNFFDLWTAREALIKAQGLSLLQNPDPAGWSTQKLDLGIGWSAHLAFQGAQDPLETFDVQDFPSELLDW